MTNDSPSLPFALDVEFRDPERSLGTTFLKEGHVNLTSEGAKGFYEAEIRHLKRQVYVWVQIRPSGRVDHGCDCPHFDETKTGCEHLYALLEALKRKLSPTPIDDEEDPAEAAGLLPRYLLHRSISDRLRAAAITAYDAAGRPLRLTHDVWASIKSDADCDAVRMLGEYCGGWQLARVGGGFKNPDPPHVPAPEAAVEIIEKLAATGRLAFGDGPQDLEHLLAPPPFKTLEFLMGLRPRAAGGFEAAGSWIGDLRFLPLDGRSPISPTRPPLLVHDRSLFRLETFGAEKWRRMLSTAAVPMSAAEWISTLEKFAREEPLPRIAFEPNSKPTPILSLNPTGTVHLLRREARIAGRVRFTYGSTTIAPASPMRLVTDVAARRQYRRNEDIESRLVRDLASFGGEIDADVPDLFWFKSGDLSQIIRALSGHHFTVWFEDRPVRRTGSFSIRTKSGTDWFSLEGGLSVEGETVPLTTLLVAARSRTDFVKLPDGGIAFLDADVRKRLAELSPLLDIGKKTAEGLEFSAAQSLMVDAVAHGLLRDPEFLAAKARMQTPLEIGEAPAPLGLAAVLRPYQAKGLAWLSALESLGMGGCLADEMGLGKTIQIIAFLLRRVESGSSRPFLVVVPRSLISNWTDEIRRFAPSLAVSVYSGASRSSDSFSANEVILTTYGILRRDIERLSQTEFDTVVLDEAQAIKNAASQIGAAVRRLKSKNRFCLTGTPVENHAGDVWSLLDFCAPGTLGTQAAFRAVAESEDAAARERCRRAIRPLILKRTKDEVAKDLPELLQQTILCPMTEGQTELYERLRKSAQATVEKKDVESSGSAVILEALLRLRQAACAPRLIDRESPADSGKLELLFDRLEECRAMGRKALVFSQFTKLLTLVRERLEEDGIPYAYLDGQTIDREAPVRRFQNEKDCTLFLISLRAGGFGLNLTAADTVFILDPWWNPAVESQAVARAHRIGQKKVVMAYRLVTAGTVEESMAALQEKKKSLADALVDGSAPTQLALEEILGLIR